ncbi:DUF4192 domain-containing protein [Tessaracoccus sp. OS52]|uniref:DUF4192 domain-containing protein n=1 Tax=Tessaracoccus sp. OS52 TaxID=2886691 RepID=UPI001D0F93FC|nr:DUF4192 domain-containing protein [Tessaracoccus sp. OS52]MCC2592657.1 DUF4192 domain-containing protein [Tessaracoccus sp. OS52]
MTSQTILRGSSRADLLCIPSIMLGFHPAESVVVVGMHGKRVEFCARLDLVQSADELRGAIEQILNARDNKPGTNFVLLGFGREVTEVTGVVNHLTSILGDLVTDAVITNGTRYWNLDNCAPTPQEGIPFEFSASALAAQAVFEGMAVRGSREEAVAAVMPPPAHERAEIAERVDQAFARVMRLDLDEAMRLFRGLLESDEALTPDDAAELAVLLQLPECLAEFLAQVTTESARRAHPRLLQARATADPECEPDVLAALAVACWLAGEGAQQNECMTQLQELEPRHPVLLLLEELHHKALPPSWWDGR